MHDDSEYRRVELITGRRKRRNWSDEEKIEILAASNEAGANISPDHTTEAHQTPNVRESKTRSAAGTISQRAVGATISKCALEPILGEINTRSLP